MAQTFSGAMAPKQPYGTPKNTEKHAWGPQLWHSMHMIALNYPDRPSPSDKLNYKLFFESLKDVIPCLACSDNYAEHLQELPVDRYLDSAGNLFAWTVHLHNIVNEFHRKRAWTIEEAVRFYSKYSGAPSGTAATTVTTDTTTPQPTAATATGAKLSAAKDMAATWFMLLVTGAIALCIVVLTVLAYTHVRRILAKGRR